MTELLDPKERSAIEWSMAEEWKIRGYRILAVVLQPRIHIAERVIVGIARNCAEVCPDCLQLTIGHICMQWPGHDLENRAIDWELVAIVRYVVGAVQMQLVEIVPGPQNLHESGQVIATLRITGVIGREITADDIRAEPRTSI